MLEKEKGIKRKTKYIWKTRKMFQKVYSINPLAAKSPPLYLKKLRDQSLAVVLLEGTLY